MSCSSCASSRPSAGQPAARAGLRGLDQRGVLRADLVAEREEPGDPVRGGAGREVGRAGDAAVAAWTAATTGYLAGLSGWARGLALLAHDAPGRAALAHAGPAAVDVTAACQQVVGALGFTLEFPLQRAYRRARAIQLWADALIAPAR